MCCWRRLLRVPWTARKSNKSILKEINPEYSLEGLMVKLKLQYFGHLVHRTDSLEKTLMLERLKEGEEVHNTEWDIGWHDRLYGMSLSKLPELLMNWEAWGALVLGLAKNWILLSKCTELNREWYQDIVLICISSSWMVNMTLFIAFFQMENLWSKKTLKLGRGRSWTKTGSQRSPIWG